MATSSKRNLRFYLSANVFTSWADNLFLIISPWMVFTFTNQIWVLGIGAALAGIPRAALLLISGSIIDRYTSKRVFIYSNLAASIIMLTLALLATSSHLNIESYLFLCLLGGTCSAFRLPSASTITPTIVKNENLLHANSTVRATTHTIKVVTPALFAYLTKDLSNNDANYSSVINPSIFLVSILFFFSSLAAMPINPITPPHSSGAINLTAGIKYIIGNTQLLFVAIYSSITGVIIIALFMVILPVFTKFQLDLGLDKYSYIVTSISAGAIIGFLMSGKIAKMINISIINLLIIGDIVIATCLILVAFFSNLASTMALLFTAALVSGVIEIISFTWIQTTTPRELLGRTISAFILFGATLSTFASGAAGLLINQDNSGMILTYCGITIALLALLALAFKANLASHT